MEKVRRGTALAAVLTLLLTSLIPATVLAADVPERAGAASRAVEICASADSAPAGSSLCFTAVVDGSAAQSGSGTWSLKKDGASVPAEACTLQPDARHNPVTVVSSADAGAGSYELTYQDMAARTSTSCQFTLTKVIPAAHTLAGGDPAETRAVTGPSSGPGTQLTGVNPGPEASGIPGTYPMDGQPGSSELTAADTRAFRYDVQPAGDCFNDSQAAPGLTLAAGFPSHPLGRLGTQLTIGTVSDAGLHVVGQTPAGASVPVSVNSRAMLCYAPSGIRRGAEVLSDDAAAAGYWADNVTLEWRYAPNAAAAAAGTSLSIPSGMGFSGVNSPLLMTGPLTAAMDGWQFRLEIHDRTNAQLAAATSWVLLDIDGVCVDAVPEPVIESIPAAQRGVVSAAAGREITFTAAAQNCLPETVLQFQWQRQAAPAGAEDESQWSDIPGAQDKTLTVPMEQAVEGARYRCVITNTSSSSNGTAVSDALTLQCAARSGSVRVTAPVARLVSICAGRTFAAGVRAAADNGAPLSYQWYVQALVGPLPDEPVTAVAQAAELVSSSPNRPVAGQTSASLLTEPLTEGVYMYTCVVRNAQDPAQGQTSAPIYVVVTERSRIPAVSQPAYRPVTSVGVEAGEPLSLPCTAYVASGEPLTYQWEWAETPDGPWTRDACAEPVLRIQQTPMSWAGRCYRCTVTNAAAQQTVTSAVYRLNVWAAVDVPRLTLVPESQELIWNGGTEEDRIVLTAEAAVSEEADCDSLLPQWQAPYGEVYTSATHPEAAGSALPTVSVSQRTEDGRIICTSTLTVPVRSEWTALRVAGTYTVTWLNVRQNGSSSGLDAEAALKTPAATELLTAPQAAADIEVSILVPGAPQIEKQSPGLTIGAVGNTATFWVSALLHEAPGDNGSLVYTWQMTDDGGATWRNCLPADGTGQFTGAFTTVTLTQTMYDDATASNVAGQGYAGGPGNANTVYMYRCLVANRSTGSNVDSSIFKLEILPEGAGGAETIVPAAGSAMTVESVDGVRYAFGLRAKRAPETTTVAEMEAILGYVPPHGFRLEVLTADGQAAAADAAAATGMTLQLVDEASGETVDRVILVVRGDVLGRGVMDIAQLYTMAQQLNGDRDLEGAYRLACDMNRAVGVDIGDLVAAAQILNGTA